MLLHNWLKVGFASSARLMMLVVTSVGVKLWLKSFVPACITTTSAVTFFLVFWFHVVFHIVGIRARKIVYGSACCFQLLIFHLLMPFNMESTVIRASVVLFYSHSCISHTNCLANVCYKQKNFAITFSTTEVSNQSHPC